MSSILAILKVRTSLLTLNIVNVPLSENSYFYRKAMTYIGQCQEILPTTTPNNLLPIQRYFKLYFTCKEPNIFHIRGGHLYLSHPKASCVFHSSQIIYWDYLVQNKSFPYTLNGRIL